MDERGPFKRPLKQPFKALVRRPGKSHKAPLKVFKNPIKKEPFVWAQVRSEFTVKRALVYKPLLYICDVIAKPQKMAENVGSSKQMYFCFEKISYLLKIIYSAAAAAAGLCCCACCLAAAANINASILFDHSVLYPRYSSGSCCCTKTAAAALAATAAAVSAAAGAAATTAATAGLILP